ncbi:MAG TPA: RNA polymerase sigma factor [Clostridiaceae bacterium]|nr:RNA polymerase sigma factor [Clostridiaceae bacterium]
MEESWEQWLEASRLGDAEAIDEMLEALMDRLYPLCLKMTGQVHDAEDCLQNSLIRIMNSLDSFSGKSSFFTWCYRITINICYDFLRQKSRQNEELWDEGSRSFPLRENQQNPVLDEVERAEKVELIREGLLNVGEPYRDTLILYELGEFSIAEIASLQDIALGTVKSRLSRGRIQLAQYLRNGEKEN